MKIWGNIEVKELFEAVENCKKKNVALRDAFVLHANKYNRRPNSVRNYYYHEVDNLAADSLRCKKLGINISFHTKSHFTSFEKSEEEELFEKIEALVQKGFSVRSACKKLSGGDLGKMTRIQNKYQNMKRKLAKPDNIIPFKQTSLSDSDINSLFMGLLKLIKKTALEEAQAATKTSGEVLKKAFSEIARKEKEISTLKQELLKLKTSSNQKLAANKTNALKQKLQQNKQLETQKEKA